MFEVLISNIKTFVPSANDSTWYDTTSQNAYTLKEVAIGSSVTRIGVFAFCGCSALESVTIATGVTSIGDRAFINCSELTRVEIPNSVTSIGN